MIKNNGRISLWDNIKFFLIYLVVLGHLANFYLEESWDVKRIFIIIYFFHMPAFIFISGLFSKKTIDQKNYKKVFEYFVLYVFIKIYLFLVKIVCGYGVAEISLLSERGVPWYAFVLAIYVLITICLKNINKKYLFIFSVVISCFAGYDPNPDKPEKFILYISPLCYSKEKGGFPLCYLRINTLIKFTVSLPVMTA